MSSALVEWVSPPMLIRSTPVPATVASDSSVMPPEASSRTVGACWLRISTARASCSGVMLSSSTMSGSALSALAN